MPTRATKTRGSRGEQGRQQAEGSEEDPQHWDETKNGDTRGRSPQLAWQAEVVCRGRYRVDLPAGGAVQEGCGDDCAEPGFEEGFAEGAIVGHADADVLREPRGEELVEEPAACAGACEDAAARARGEDARRDGEEQGRTAPQLSALAFRHFAEMSERSRVPLVMGTLEKSLAASRTEHVFSATQPLSRIVAEPY